MDVDMLEDIAGESSMQHSSPCATLSLLSDLPSSRLIPTGDNASKSCVIEPDIPVCQQAGAVISKIEEILHQLVDSIANDNKTELVIYLKSRKSTAPQTLDRISGAIQCAEDTAPRAIRFPGKTAQEAWKFTVLLRVLNLSHQALVTGVVTTKRDIYYQAPELFIKQEVVDRYVDDLAFTLGVKRDALNIVAAGKGLVAGHLTIVKKDGETIDCSQDARGTLILNVDEIDHVEARGNLWILVIEKEATFNTLSTSRFWDTLTAGRLVLVTGKGYPDIVTRAFVRLLSSQPQSSSGTTRPRVFALMDYDPDGLTILSTYKYGSGSLAHENRSLVTPSLEWLGIKSDVIRHLNHDKSQSSLKLTTRDRRMAKLLLEKVVFQRDVENEWRRELQVMLMLNMKAEIQILGPSLDFEEFLSSKLKEHLLDHSFGQI